MAEKSDLKYAIFSQLQYAIPLSLDCYKNKKMSYRVLAFFLPSVIYGTRLDDENVSRDDVMPI